MKMVGMSRIRPRTESGRKGAAGRLPDPLQKARFGRRFRGGDADLAAIRAAADAEARDIERLASGVLAERAGGSTVAAAAFQASADTQTGQIGAERAPRQRRGTGIQPIRDRPCHGAGEHGRRIEADGGSRRALQAERLDDDRLLDLAGGVGLRADRSRFHAGARDGVEGGEAIIRGTRRGGGRVLDRCARRRGSGRDGLVRRLGRSPWRAGQIERPGRRQRRCGLGFPRARLIRAGEGWRRGQCERRTGRQGD